MVKGCKGMGLCLIRSKEVNGGQQVARVPFMEVINEFLSL